MAFTDFQKMPNQGELARIAEDGDVQVPAGIKDYGEAIKILQRQMVQLNQAVGIHTDFKALPLDGMVAFHMALANLYSWVSLTPKDGFFGPQPPTMVSVPVSYNRTLQVPYGSVKVPNFTGELSTQVNHETQSFTLAGQTIQKHQPQLDRIIETIQSYLDNHSIYADTAFKLSFDWKRKGQSYNMIANAPQFMNLSGVNPNDLVLPEEAQAALNVGLWTPLLYSDACRERGLPLQRRVLLSGEPGTGKTMSVYVTAMNAVANGFTFCLLESPLDLVDAIETVTRQIKGPAVIFCEDIEKVTAMGARDEDMNKLFLAVDGIESKGQPLILVFTTNNENQIHAVFRRAGRIDTVVRLGRPDQQAAITLVRKYVGESLAPEQDMREVGVALKGQLPSTITEIARLAGYASVWHSKGESGELITSQDLLLAHKGMTPHIKFIEEGLDQEKKLLSAVPPTADEIIAEKVVTGLAESLNGKFSDEVARKVADQLS